MIWFREYDALNASRRWPCASGAPDEGQGKRLPIAAEAEGKIKRAKSFEKDVEVDGASIWMRER